MLLVVDVAADILTAVFPGESTNAMHFVVEPFALESTVIAPDVDAFSGYVIILEVTNIAWLIIPFEHTDTMLFTIFIDALEDCAVGPDLSSKSILLIVAPKADIFWTECAFEGAESVRPVIKPLTVVTVSIVMN
jgi:hypothetical protein